MTEPAENQAVQTSALRSNREGRRARGRRALPGQVFSEEERRRVGGLFAWWLLQPVRRGDTIVASSSNEDSESSSDVQRAVAPLKSRMSRLFSSLRKRERDGDDGEARAAEAVGIEEDVLRSWEYEHGGLILEHLCIKDEVARAELRSELLIVGGECRMHPYIAEARQWMQDANKAGEVAAALVLADVMVGDHYDARVRVAVRRMLQMCQVPDDVLRAAEMRLALDMSGEGDESRSGDGGTSERGAGESRGRWWKVSLGVIGGGAALALTGGLAAPALLGLFGTVMTGAGLASIGALASTAIAPTVVTGIFGYAGARVAGNKIAARTAGIDELELEPKSAVKSLSACVCIRGFLSDHNIGHELCFSLDCKELEGMDHFYVRWETEQLKDLGKNLYETLSEWLGGQARESITIQGLATLTAAAITWPIRLLSFASMLDHPWAMAVDRADKAGPLLADMIAENAVGRRPVRLIGVSTGARLLFRALEALADLEGDTSGIVEDCVLFGCPVPAGDTEAWQKVKSVVSGRLVNVYSRKDWMLKLAYRAANTSVARVAGTNRVFVRSDEEQTSFTFEPRASFDDQEEIDISDERQDEEETEKVELTTYFCHELRVESVDVSAVVRSHTQYDDTVARLTDELFSSSYLEKLFDLKQRL